MRRWVGPAVALLAAVVAFVALTAGGSDPSDRAPAIEPTEITSDATLHRSVEELVAASDLVVAGRVVRTERGRTFGDPGATSIESRLVTLEIEEVLHSGLERSFLPAGGSVILVEEPGWLEDGTPLVVDGVSPSEVGDEVIWFLAAIPSPALEAADARPAFTLVGPQGHYRIDGDDLVASAVEDELITRLESLGPDGLRALVTTAAP